MSNFSWVYFSNKMLNFGVLVAACTYLSKKYIIPLIKKSMHEREQQHLALEQEAVKLRLQKNALEDAIDQKKIYARQLLIKIQQWKNVREERATLRQQEQKKFEDRSVDYLKKRADGVCQEFLKREVTPRILTETREKVTNFFGDRKNHRDYLDASVSFFKKRTARG